MRAVISMIILPSSRRFNFILRRESKDDTHNGSHLVKKDGIEWDEVDFIAIRNPHR